MVGVRCACKGYGVDASGTVCPCACKAWRVVNFCCLSTSGLINFCLLYKIFASGISCVCTVSPVVYLVRKSAVCLVELYISAYNDKVSGFVGRFQFPACSRGCSYYPLTCISNPSSMSGWTNAVISSTVYLPRDLSGVSLSIV